MQHREMIVVGGGASGVTMALSAARLGVNVLLVEKDEILGKQTNLAQNIMRKALSECAQSVSVVDRISTMGCADVNLNRVLGYARGSWNKFPKQSVINDLAKYNVEVWLGEARFIAPDVITVGGRVITSKRVVLAPGASNGYFNIPGLDSIDYLVPSTFFLQENLPDKIAIIGLSVIGLEIAQALAKIGKDVLVITLPNKRNWEEAAFSKLQDWLKDDGIQFHHVHKIKEVYEQNNRSIMVCKDDYDDNFTLDAHKIILTEPSVSQFSHNFSAASINFTGQGIWTDSSFMCSKKGIYAIGGSIDIRNPYHNTEEQVAVALHNITLGTPKRKYETPFDIKMIRTQPGYVEVGLEGDDKKARSFKSLLTGFDKYPPLKKCNIEIEWVTIRNRVVGIKAFGYDSEHLASNLMHTLCSDAHIWDFARLPHLPGTVSHVLRKMIEQQQPDSFFPKWVGAWARINDRICDMLSSILDRGRNMLKVYTSKLKSVR